MVNQPFIDRYLAEMQQVAGSLPRADVDRAIETLFDAWKRQATVFLIGNGGSASTATHFACDLSKVTISPGKPRLRAVSLCDNLPLMSAWINDHGFEHLFSEQLRNLMRPGDVLIAISVHGGLGQDRGGPWSQNLLRAVRAAREEFASTVIGFAGFDGGALKELADICVVVPAASTPQVESFHLALEHLITFCLQEKIAAYQDDAPG
ncbi:MAG TPA: SIS domain-containing protein [Bryobacterales bacterium]|nr:SIS domain-containing protein [Bryobacterales bacterium]